MELREASELGCVKKAKGIFIPLHQKRLCFFVFVAKQKSNFSDLSYEQKQVCFSFSVFIFRKVQFDPGFQI